MANTLDVTIALTGSGILTNPLDASTPTDQMEIGTNFPELEITLTTGTGNNQANSWWHDKRTLAATTTDTITISGGSAVTNGFGQSLDLSSTGTVKAVIFAVDSPDGTKAIRVGPQADANAAALGVTGTGTAANAYVLVKHWIPFIDTYGGFAPNTHILVHNPGASSVDYWVWFLSEK
jgi:hypothetical protein